MPRSWGRLYAGTRNHRKIKILAQRHPGLWMAWYVFLDMAIEIDDDGWIYVSPDHPYTIKELAKEMRIRREDHLKDLCKTLEDLGMIAVTDQGIQVLSYSDRNFESDVSTVRVQKYRERTKCETLQKRFRNGDETKHETPQNRTDTEQIQNRTEINTLSTEPPVDRSNGFKIESLAKLWNDKAPPELSRVNLPFKRNPQKLKPLKTMIGLYPEETWWSDLIAKLYQSSFLRGKNNRGWKATFDFVVSKADEIADGKYLDLGGANQTEQTINTAYGWAKRREAQRNESA